MMRVSAYTATDGSLFVSKPACRLHDARLAIHKMCDDLKLDPETAGLICEHFAPFAAAVTELDRAHEQVAKQTTAGVTSAIADALA